MVHRTKLLSAEYQALFKRYLEDRVPNQGSGFFGQWAWHAARENEFRGQDGYAIARLMPRSLTPPIRKHRGQAKRT